MTNQKRSVLPSGFFLVILFFSFFNFSCSYGQNEDDVILNDWERIENNYHHKDKESFYKNLQVLQEDFSSFSNTNQFIILEYTGTDLNDFEKYDFYHDLRLNVSALFEDMRKADFNSQEMNDYLFALRIYILKMQEMDYQTSATTIRYCFLIFGILMAFLVSITTLLYFVTLKYEKECKKLEDLNAYSQIMIDGIELERKRISREIHDTVIQDIKVLQLENEAYQTDNFSQENLYHNEKIKMITDSTMKQLRSICGNLTPKETKSSVVTAISNLCREFEQKNNIKLNLKIQDNLFSENLSTQRKLHIIRIVQEALSNIEMHSKATTVSVLIRNKETTEQNKIQRKLLIFIVDNGTGFDVNTKTSKTNHFGLKNIQERANLLGGKIDIISEIGEGTEITLEVPLYE